MGRILVNLSFCRNGKLIATKQMVVGNLILVIGWLKNKFGS
jgi:hypothetical protein